MPLINKRLLEKTLNKYRHDISRDKKNELKTLFKQTLERIDKKKFKKEESEKVPFLQKMFELLGYKLHQNLEFEFSTQGRSIDGVLGEVAEGLSLQNKESEFLPQVAIEWKGTNTKSLDKGKAGETPVSQMWDYMGKVGAEIGIVGNFIEWRLYTLQTKQSEYWEFNLRQLAENEDKLDELIFLLRKSTVLKSDKKTCLLQDLINESEAEQEQITKNFYNDYKQRRTNLFNHLIDNNEDKDKHLLLEKTQKVLDRLIFVMFCEDGYLISSNTVKNTYDQARNTILPTPTKIWDFFKGLFLAIDKGNDYPKINAFNGGLFSDDPELNSLIIKDQIWADLVKLAEYDFGSDLDVNILGHIFEQSISDIEEIKAELEGETTDKKKSKRKKDGIYYTPEYITDYIVSETIGNWLEDQSVEEPLRFQSENGMASIPLRNIKILDPAGGSGAFPNQVHSYLAKKTADLENQEAIEGGLESLAYQDASTIDKGILKNNIYMVDLQPESVEIAKLSLWLKTARKDQKLNNLDENVKVGNSLKLNWRELFGINGFNAIVGNPPYIKEYTNKSAFDGLHDNSYYQGKMDLWTMFACQSIDELEDGGYLSFIAPNNWISNAGASIFRDKILTDGELKTFVDFGDFKVFEDAGIQTMIFVFKKCKPREKYTVDYARVEDKNIGLEKIKLLLSSRLKADIEGVNKFEAEIQPAKLKGKNLAFVDKKVNEVLEKMEAGNRWFLDKKEVAQGIVAPQEFITERHLENSNIEAELNEGIFQITTKEKEKLNFTAEELEYIKPFYTTEQLGKYITNPQNNLWVIYTKSDIKTKIDNLPNIKAHLDRFSEVITSDNKPYGLHRARDEKFFKGDKIVSLRKCTEPTFCFTDFDCYLSQTYYIIKTDKVNLKFLTGVLNSKIVAFWLRYKGKMQGDLYQIDKDPLLNIPIPKATQEQQVQTAELVDQIMTLKQDNQSLTDSLLKLIKAKYKVSQISTKLKKWYELETADFLDELKKLKLNLGFSEEAELINYFEAEKTKVNQSQTKINQVDQQIEELVRGLYGLSDS